MRQTLIVTIFDGIRRRGCGKIITVMSVNFFENMTTFMNECYLKKITIIIIIAGGRGERENALF